MINNPLSLGSFYAIAGYYPRMNALPSEKKTEPGKLAFSDSHYS